MACEPKRGCGYRRIGGIYLVGGGSGFPCDRLPFQLEICPTCSNGIKYSRGWTWVDVNKLVGGVHLTKNIAYDGIVNLPCSEALICPFCGPEHLGRAGLLWIGHQFYKTPQEFIAEADALGISRRIKAVPRKFKLGETWVLLGHVRACIQEVEVATELELPNVKKLVFKPGIFRVFKPERVEKIITETQSKDTEFMEKLEKKGFTPVIVEDSDPDHQGSIWDKEDSEPAGN